MAYRTIDREMYDKLIVAFREYGENWSKVSRVVGVGQRTAKKAWEQGWPRRKFKAIKDVVGDDQLAARSAIEKSQRLAISGREQMLEEARENAIKARKQEGQMTQMARGGAINVLAAALKLLKTTGPLVRELEDEIYSELAKPKEERILGISKMIEVLERVGRYTQQGSSLAEVSMRLERLYLGAPETIIGVQVEEMSPQQAMIELREAEAALARFDAGIIDAEIVE